VSQAFGHFRVGFVTGATPDKWARTWRSRYSRDPLELVPLDEEEQEARVRDQGRGAQLKRWIGQELRLGAFPICGW
jgi:hypothetical protein